MKRIAFFVEGLSEQLFIEKLMTEILGSKKISLEKRKMQGGSKSTISIMQIGSPKIEEGADFYMLIVDCGGETTVSSYIRDQRKSLINKGYLIIFGLLDVRPNWTREQIPRLEKFLYYKLPQKDLKTKFLISVMEIESWFLAEENHYKNIHPDLDIKKFNSFDPLSDTELIEEPASLLHDIYQIVGFAYKKDKKKISRTVDSLDYANLYFNVVNRNNSLNILVDAIHDVI